MIIYNCIIIIIIYIDNIIYEGIDEDEDAIKVAKKKKTGVHFRKEDLFNLEIDRTRRFF